MTPLEQAVHRAIALHQAGELDAAQAAYETILKQHPRDPNVLMNLSTLLKARGQTAEAGKLLKKLIAAYPKLPQPYYGLGVVLMEQEKFDEAVAQFERSLALQPGQGNAHWNLALCHLLRGDYARGLPHFEWRFESDHLRHARRHFAEPLWLGAEPIVGKTLLIYAEQGFGDFLQCARFFPMLQTRGATLLVELPPALLALMRESFPEVTFVPAGSPLPRFDLQCPIMSLPLALGLTLETMPSAMRYLKIPAERAEYVRGWLGPKRAFRIGLAWSGAANHAQDWNRSIPLAQLAELLGLPVEFHALQKELRPADAAHLGPMAFHGERLRDFADTAALVAEMDLVLSVDTSVAHLAAALAKPTWILLYQPPDYRWMLNRTDSPLYPTVRLFRQPRTGDWPNAISAVIEAVNHLLSGQIL